MKRIPLLSLMLIFFICPAFALSGNEECQVLCDGLKEKGKAVDKVHLLKALSRYHNALDGVYASLSSKPVGQSWVSELYRISKSKGLPHSSERLMIIAISSRKELVKLAGENAVSIIERDFRTPANLSSINSRSKAFDAPVPNLLRPAIKPNLIE